MVASKHGGEWLSFAAICKENVYALEKMMTRLVVVVFTELEVRLKNEIKMNSSRCSIWREPIGSLLNLHLPSTRQMYTFIMQTGLKETSRRADFTTVARNTQTDAKLRSRFFRPAYLYKQVNINQVCVRRFQLSGPENSTMISSLRKVWWRNRSGYDVRWTFLIILRSFIWQEILWYF